MVPFAPLAELASHEHQLLAGMRVHVAVEGPQRRGLLPVVAGDLAEHRSLPVDDFVVGERQHEVLAEGVHQRERDLVVVPAAVDRILSRTYSRMSFIHPMFHL